jgi:Flp pilus assembly protein TadD
MPIANRYTRNMKAMALVLGMALGGLGLVGCAAPAAKKPVVVRAMPPQVPLETSGRTLLKGDPHVTAHDFFLRARQLENEGNDPVALGYYRIAYEYDPESRDLCFILLDKLRNAGLVDTALNYGRRCLELKGEPEVDDYKTLGELHLRHSDLPQAVTMYEKALALDDADRDLLYTLATLYESLKQPAKQVEVASRLLPRLDYPQRLVEKQVELLKSLSRDAEIPRLYLAAWDRGNNPAFGEKLADWYEEVGLWDSLLIMTRRLSQEDPEPLHYQLRYARALALSGAEDSAIAVYTQLLRKNPEEREVLFPFALLLFEHKSYKEAKSLFTKLVQQKPDQALYQFLLGSVALDLNEMRFAEGALKKALDLEPRVPEYWSKLVSVKIKRGAMPQADSILAQLNSNDTLDLPAHFLRGAVYTLLARRYEMPPGGLATLEDADTVLMRRFRRASIEAYRDVLKIDYRNRRGLFEMGVALERLGQQDSAVALLRQLVALDTNDATAANYLGYMLVEANRDLELAGKLIARALSLEPANGAFLDSQGWWFFRVGKDDKALDCLRQALEKMPHDTTVLEHYALILERLGKNTEALHQWQEILRLDPHNTLATRKVN